MFEILIAAALLSGQDAAGARSPSDLTRDLNSGPPFTPAASAPADPPVLPPPSSSPAPVAAPARPTAAVTGDLNRMPPASASRPAVAPPTAAAPAAVVSTSASSPPAPVSSAPPPAPQGLDAAAIAALPFTLDLPANAAVTRSRAGADGAVYTVRRGDAALVMIYTGPASQFPIYDGQIVQAAGRASVVVAEDGRRLALEHLFQRASAPQEIHVWVASPAGADRDQGERIAQSIDAR